MHCINSTHYIVDTITGSYSIQEKNSEWLIDGYHLVDVCNTLNEAKDLINAFTSIIGGV